jgi:D-alanine--poly(phosphoribitol) ligase subunit 2
MSATEAPTRHQVRQLVCEAIEDLNAGLTDGRRIETDEAMRLFGAGGALDSLGLVSLVVALEQRIAEGCGVEVTLADEKAMSRRSSPFRTVGALTDYVLEVLRGTPDV